MRKSILYPLGVCMVIAVMVLIFGPKTTSAQMGGHFDGVIPFSTSGGFLGFFDQKSGTVYLYDQNYTKCVRVSKIDQLGKPMEISQ